MKDERQQAAFRRLRKAEVGVANVEESLRRHASAYSRELNGWQMLKANDEISDSTATFLGHYFADHVDIVRDLNNAEDALSSAAVAARRIRAVRWYARQESNFSEDFEDDIRKFENWQAERDHHPAITRRSQYDGKEYCWVEIDRVLRWLRGWTGDDFQRFDTAQQAFRRGTNLDRPFDQKAARPSETFREAAADIIGDTLVDALEENLIEGLIESVVTDAPEQPNIEPRTRREKLERKANVFPSLKPIVVGEEFGGMIDRKTRRKIDKSRTQGLLQWETMKEAGLVTDLPGPPSPSEYLASEAGQGKSRPTATRKRPRQKVPQNILHGIVPSAIFHSARQRSAKQAAGQQNETTMQRAVRRRQ